jgi:arginine N-succinyltransferase
VILLREIQERDIDALERFSQIPGFINLPNDKDMLKDLIQRATKSFKQKVSEKNEKFDGKYIFVAEDIPDGEKEGTVFGTSMIAAQHGTVESPHFYFDVSNEKKFSETINTGFIHGTLKLKYDTNGPSEIGGLVVDPSYRNNDARIGRQISFVRFLFAGLNKERFKRKVIAELLPPLNKKGQSPLWEAIGRRFTNMDYWEADKLCQKNKEFIFSLFPTGKIYTSFLPAEARNAIGKVGKETEPVLHMLKKIGFEYKNQVDPFDGGPHLWASLEDILPIKKIKTYVYDPTLPEDAQSESGLLTRAVVAGSKSNPELGRFREMHAKATLKGQKIGFSEPSQAQLAERLGVEPGASVVFMPYY